MFKLRRSGTKIGSYPEFDVQLKLRSALSTFSPDRPKGNITWSNITLEHTEKATYLGVTLDRPSIYRFHYEKTRKKDTRNNLLEKLSNSKWGANPTVLRSKGRRYASQRWNTQAQYGRDLDTPRLNASLNEFTERSKQTFDNRHPLFGHDRTLD